MHAPAAQKRPDGQAFPQAPQFSGSTSRSVQPPLQVVQLAGQPEPVAPMAPVAPPEPVAPVAPVAASGPLAPVLPVAPVGPMPPVGPVAPRGPFGPGEPHATATATSAVTAIAVLGDTPTSISHACPTDRIHPCPGRTRRKSRSVIPRASMLDRVRSAGGPGRSSSRRGTTSSANAAASNARSVRFAAPVNCLRGLATRWRCAGGTRTSRRGVERVCHASRPSLT